MDNLSININNTELDFNEKDKMSLYGASSLRWPWQTPQTERPEYKKFTSSKFWRLEVKDQSVGGVVPSEASLLGS